MARMKDRKGVGITFTESLNGPGTISAELRGSISDKRYVAKKRSSFAFGRLSNFLSLTQQITFQGNYIGNQEHW